MACRIVNRSLIVVMSLYAAYIKTVVFHLFIGDRKHLQFLYHFKRMFHAVGVIEIKKGDEVKLKVES